MQNTIIIDIQSHVRKHQFRRVHRIRTPHVYSILVYFSLQWRYNDADQIKYQSSRVTGLCEGNSPHKGPVKRKTFHWWRHHVGTYSILSSAWYEYDPHTAYVVCISISLGFPFMISVVPCFPYMVMLPKYSNVKANVLDTASMCAAMDVALSQGLLLLLYDITTIWSSLFHWIRTELNGSPGRVIMGCQLMIYLLDFEATCQRPLTSLPIRGDPLLSNDSYHI